MTDDPPGVSAAASAASWSASAPVPPPSSTAAASSVRPPASRAGWSKEWAAQRGSLPGDRAAAGRRGRTDGGSGRHRNSDRDGDGGAGDGGHAGRPGAAVPAPRRRLSKIPLRAFSDIAGRAVAAVAAAVPRQRPAGERSEHTTGATAAAPWQAFRERARPAGVTAPDVTAPDVTAPDVTAPGARGTWGRPARTRRDIVLRSVRRVKDAAWGGRPAGAGRNGSHRVRGLAAAIGSYRQPALLAALVAVAVMLVADPPAPLQSRQEASSLQAAEQDGGKRTQQQRGAGSKGDSAQDEGRRKPAQGRPPAPAQVRPVAPPAAIPPAEPSASASPSGPAAQKEARGSGKLYGPAGSLRVTGTKDVALTFDDGPDPVQTPALLDLLLAQQVKATFCVVGRRATAFPDLIRRIAAEGHTLCNHSWNHSFVLGANRRAEIVKDLVDTNEAIRAAAPDARIDYFRAPGGNFTAPLVTVAAELGMTSIHWDVDPRDWEKDADATDAEHRRRIIESVEKDVREGSIILSHDFDQPQTIKAYEVLVPWLKERYPLAALPPPA